MQYQLGDKIGKYVVDRPLGEGGMAVVYKVRHVTLDMPFALKIPKSKRGITAERLMREAKVQGRLRHPNIVSLLDLIEHDDRLCLLMEFVNGQPLNRSASAQRVDGLSAALLQEAECHIRRYLQRALRRKVGMRLARRMHTRSGLEGSGYEDRQRNLRNLPAMAYHGGRAWLGLGRVPGDGQHGMLVW